MFWSKVEKAQSTLNKTVRRNMDINDSASEDAEGSEEHG